MPDSNRTMLVLAHTGKANALRSARLVVERLLAAGVAVRAVTDAAASLGLGVRDVTTSPLPGPAGHVEYFVWLRRGAPPLSDDALRHAIETGPDA